MIKVVLNIKKENYRTPLHAVKGTLSNKQHLESLGKFLIVAIGEPGALKNKNKKFKYFWFSEKCTLYENY